MNAIEKLQQDFNRWYETSSIGQFLSWWKTELKSFVPEKYQEKLFPTPTCVYLTPENENMTVWYQKGVVLEKYSNKEDEQEDWWHQVQHIVNQADGEQVLVKYLLPNQEVLVKKIGLPQAAKDNLDEVIGFELDKYVPFSADQVQLSYIIDRQNKDENKIQLDLAVIPKQTVIDILDMCDKKSIILDAIDVNKSKQYLEPNYLGVNLLPADKRKAADYFKLKLNGGLLFLLILLIYFVMHTSLANKQNKIDKLTSINNQLQKKAKTSKLLKKELKEVIVSSKFLQNKKQESPALIILFHEITAILPNHTYITRFKVDKDKIEVTGLSENANSLIPLLDESDFWYLPQIVGGITVDPRTKKEKFTIKAELKEPQLEVQDDSNS
jgi:general secretion pathway protein L